MKIGYVRCSSKDQNPERQEVLMAKLGVDKVYLDMMSGKDTNRPQLKEMMSFMRNGDTVIVESISRLARNTRDLLEITDEMTKKGVKFVSQKETIDTTTPFGTMVLTIFGAIAQMERDYIRERQKEGIDLKKARGEYKGKVAIKVDEKLFAGEYGLWKREQITARAAMKHLSVKPNTFYRMVKRYEETGSPNGAEE